MRIGIAFDLAPADPALRSEGPDDRFEEFDKPETVEAIAEVIRGEGHDVILLGDGREFLTRILAEPPDFVFNIAEGEGVGRCREARVPAVLEMLGIPYSGSDPLTLAACLDKDVARRLMYDDIGVPEGMLLSASIPIPLEAQISLLSISYGPGGPLVDDSLPFPMIFKPALEGSSKGIRGQCVASNRTDALAIFKRLSEEYHQPVMAERFIDGDEVTVGIIGNRGANPGFQYDFSGMMKISPKRTDEPFVYSLEVKRDWRNRVEYQAPAQLSFKASIAVRYAATQAYGALECRDFARIDFRIDAEGKPWFIEANPLPGLAPETSDLVILARGHGIEYPALIRMILNAGLKRVGLS